MSSDADEPVAMFCPGCALVMPLGTTECPKCGLGRSSQTNGTTWAERWEGVQALFWFAVILGILGGVCYGLYAGAIWVKEQFDSADTVVRKAVRCYEDAEKHPWRMEECDKLAARGKALEKREEAERFCKEKGLKFKGTVGDQTECAP